MNNQQITNRLNDLRAYGFAIEDKQSNEYLAIAKDEKRVAEIVRAVHYGQSKLSRLYTADKILTKWGF